MATLLRVLALSMVFVGSSAFPKTAKMDESSWVVIVAGSNGYQNYRHQADACHAYHTVLGRNVTADRIVLMMYDDIAHNEGNPFPGKLFNTADGNDVYQGCKIDYTGSQVTMDNFFKVLHGDASSKGKVLQSKATDDVFIIYTDHGAPGYVTFPAGPAMHASDLNIALTKMYTLEKYKSLLFYMDACNSGSMFADGLLKAPNLLAVAAAKPTEESFAAFCPPYDKVKSQNNRETFSCLGDVFSINWMQDATAAAKTEEVGTQVDNVTNETARVRPHTDPTHISHAQQYGDMKIRSDGIGTYEGRLGGSSARAAPMHGVVSSRDVPLHLARYKMEVATTEATAATAQRKYQAIIDARTLADKQYYGIAEAAASVTPGLSAVSVLGMNAGTVPDVDVVCYKWALDLAADQCGRMDDYSMRYSVVLANLCHRSRVNSAKATISNAIKTACKAPLKSDGHTL